jgi:uncharacterized 2Fe-2S/4Fe-4S cluster protein (DUF4445 family)
LYIPSDCGGRSTCGKCKVVIRPLPKTTERDILHLTNQEIELGIRLACDHAVEVDSQVEIVRSPSKARILVDGVSDITSVSVDEGFVEQFGVAVDIGTTTIVTYLMDLETGQQIATASKLNPQIAFGEDIVSRLTAASKNESNRSTLQDMLINAIDELAEHLLNQLEIAKDKLAKFSVVGNTAMHHFFLGLDTATLNLAPYTPMTVESKVVQADELGFNDYSAEIYCGPLIAGFVGSDITALLVSQNLHNADDVVLGIDVGTNGEIVLSDRGKIYACSTAAGSAFEGATISYGMRGQDGAIEHVTISGLDDKPEITVIGHTEPRGLCGSGIVDIVSELLKVGLVTPAGRLEHSIRTFEDSSKGHSYTVIEKNEYNSNTRILFTQKDIRQVQLAKSAILSGSKILLSEAGLTEKSIDRILLAGAFGNYINPEAALSIGLLPRVDLDKLVQVGNTAGLGAKLMLLSSKKRELAESITKSVTYVELAGRHDFEELFIRLTQFPE